jgi:hypothetical protein
MDRPAFFSVCQRGRDQPSWRGDVHLKHTRNTGSQAWPGSETPRAEGRKSTQQRHASSSLLLWPYVPLPLARNTEKRPETPKQQINNKKKPSPQDTATALRSLRRWHAMLPDKNGTPATWTKNLDNKKQISDKDRKNIKRPPWDLNPRPQGKEPCALSTELDKLWVHNWARCHVGATMSVCASAARRH